MRPGLILVGVAADPHVSRRVVTFHNGLRELVRDNGWPYAPVQGASQQCDED
jgi:hypothetical protein